MTYHPVIIVDSGILVAYYSVKDRYHQQVQVFFERCTSNLVTTTDCVTEVVWLLSPNERYADLPGDFADLSLIAISERLNISAIATLDSDFDVYRRYRKQAFERVFRPEE